MICFICGASATPTHGAESPHPEGVAIPSAPSAKANTTLTVSRPTTYIAEPLRPYGWPDYLRLRRSESDGVTAADNAAVLISRALGPGVVAPEDRAAFFRAIGTADLPETRRLLRGLRLGLKKRGLSPVGGDGKHDPFLAGVPPLRARGWKATARLLPGGLRTTSGRWPWRRRRASGHVTMSRVLATATPAC